MKAKHFNTAREAHNYEKANPKAGDAVMINERFWVVDEAAISRLDREGIDFAFVCSHNDQLVTIPC